MSAVPRASQILLVGQKIRQIRKSRHLTQADLASRIGVTQSDLSRMENGEYKVGLDTLFRILQVFELSMSNFFEEPAAEPEAPSGGAAAEDVKDVKVSTDVPFEDWASLSDDSRREALALLETGDFSPALAAYDRALETANATNDPAFVDWMFVCRAAAAAELGPADQELVELKCVLLRSLDPGTSFRAAYTAARIYEIRRNYPRAASYNARARSLVARLSDPLLAGAAENQAGSILAADSRFAESAASYRRCLDLADLSKATQGRTPAPFSPAWRAICQDNLGYSLIALDQVSEGLALVHESFETLEALGARAYSIVPLGDLCFGYLKGDRYAEARYFGEAALE